MCALIKTRCLLLAMWLAIGNVCAAEPAGEPVTDLRVLVDVSGSMKRNDPHNLRRVALRLLIGMLPQDSRAGLWSFGQYVNMQVKPGFANRAWKQQARQEASTIHSRGLFTNIEDTLRKSSWDWRRPDPQWDRHVILLTDGMVDISKDPAKNASSRQRILGELVKQFKHAGVRVHTIALSQQADHELLSTLSRETDGWYEAVESADRLQRLFLRLFEKTTNMESLPLEENRFEVDSSVSDMTLLVFHKAGSKPTRVLGPGNIEIAQGKLPANTEWYSDQGFDIVTVHKPAEGSWRIDAAQDRDNRVKVITNLKLQLAPLPTNVLRNEAVTLKASLQQQDGLLDDNAILELVEMKLSTGRAGQQPAEQPLPAGAAAGYYETLVQGLDEQGDVEIIVRAMGPTFRRESRHEIKVHDNPLQLAITQQDGSHVITVTENPLLVQAGSLQLALRIEGVEGAYQLPKVGEHSWQATVDKSYSGKTVYVDAKARLVAGREFRTTLQGHFPGSKVVKEPPIEPGSSDDTKQDINPYALDEQELADKQTVSEERVEDKPDEEPVDASQQEASEAGGDNKVTRPKQTNWLLVILVLVLVNATIFIGGYFGYRFWKRRNRPVNENLDEQSAEELAQVESTMAASAEVATDDEVPVLTEETIDTNPGEDFSAERREEQPATLEVDLGDDAGEGVEDSTAIEMTGDEEMPELEVSDEDEIPELDVDDESTNTVPGQDEPGETEKDQ